MSTPHPKRRRLDGPVHKPFRSPLKHNNDSNPTRSPATKPSPLSTSIPAPAPSTQDEIPDSDGSSPTSTNAALELSPSSPDAPPQVSPAKAVHGPTPPTTTELKDQIALLKAHLSSRSSSGLLALERKWLLATRSAAELLLPSARERGMSTRNLDREDRLRAMLAEMEGVIDAGFDGEGSRLGQVERGRMEEEAEVVRERIRREEEGGKEVGMGEMLRAVLGEEGEMLGWDEEEGGWRED